MADEQHDREGVKDEDVKDLEESAKSMGVEDADRKDPETIVEEVQHTQTDSESSPSGWKAERDEDSEGA